MRIASLAALAVLLACQMTAFAGGRTGQARSVEVLAKRTAASPRGATEWGGKSVAFIHAQQKQSRAELRRSTPGSQAMVTAIARNQANHELRAIVGKHLGLTPGQLASKDRRHDRAVLKQLRRMVRQVRAPGSQRNPGLEAQLTAEIAKIQQRQDAAHRTVH
jgi:hypothetical protein